MQQQGDAAAERAHGSAVDEEDEGDEQKQEEEEEQEAQRRPRQPRGKRQRSSQGSRQTRHPAEPGRSSKPQRRAKPKAAQAKPAPRQAQKHLPLREPQMAAPPQQLTQPLPSPPQLPQPPHPVAAVGQAQQLRPATLVVAAPPPALLVAAPPQGPTSPLPDTRPPDAPPRQAAASGSQQAAPAPASATCRAQSSQLDWEALLGPGAALLPVPPVGAAREWRGSSSAASWPNLPVGPAELEELCAIETPLFPEWERPQPAAAAAAAPAESSPQPPAAWSQPRPAALAGSGGLQVPLPMPWQGGMQPGMVGGSAVSAAQARAALMHPTGLAGQQPLGPALVAAQPPAPPAQPAQQWQQWPPAPTQHECASPLQQQCWGAVWAEQQLSAARSAVESLPAPPLLHAAAPSAGLPAGSPGCGVAWGAPGLDASAAAVDPVGAGALAAGAAPAWQYPAW